MSSMILETEEQRRRRVSAVIRDRVQAEVIDDLVQMGRSGELTDQWLTPAELNAWLDQKGYWVSHNDLMARFLSLETCEQILTAALDVLVNTQPDAWIGTGDRYKPAFHDWNAYAAEKANLLARQMPDADRTVIHDGPGGQSLLFAHDNYATDPQAREQVTLLRQRLFEAGIPELGFGVSHDGRTWVMVVSSPDPAALDAALLAAWQTTAVA